MGSRANIARQGLVLTSVLLLVVLVSFAAAAQVRLTSMSIKECLADEYTRFRITNDTGEDVEVTWVAHVGGYPSGTVTVGAAHTMAARFTNPFYIFVPVPHHVTVSIRVDGTQVDVKSSGGAVTKCEAEISTTSLPSGSYGASYSATLRATGCDCTTPYTWSLASGSLPDGLDLDADSGTISGTPVESGTFTFDILVQDSNDHTDTRRYSITVRRAELVITADNQEKIYDGEPFTDFTVSYDGFVGGEGPRDLGGSLEFSGDAVDAVEPGRYTIEPGGLSSGDYNISFEAGTLRIRPYRAVEPPGDEFSIFDRAVAGGAGSYDEWVVEAIYEIGEPIVVSFELADFYGNPVTGLTCGVGLTRLFEDGKQRLAKYALVSYDEDLGMYYLTIATDDLKPGYYFLYVDGVQFDKQLIQLSEPQE